MRPMRNLLELDLRSHFASEGGHSSSDPAFHVPLATSTTTMLLFETKGTRRPSTMAVATKG
jgi:hypothetical protein